MQIDWTQIILAVIAFIGAVVTGFVIPYIKSKLTEKQQNSLAFWLNILVASAETLYKSEEGQKKKEWVIMRLGELGIKFDAQTISDSIEAMVRELTASGVIN